MKATKLLMGISLLALPLVAIAGPAKPGKWETTVQMEMGAQKMPAHTFSRCVTAEEAANAEKLIPQGPHQRPDCHIKDVMTTGNTVTWKMSCDKTGMSGDGKITYAGDSYTGTFHMQTQQRGEVTVTYTGKYAGACDK